MPVIPLATRSQHVDFAYEQVVRPHRSYRPSGGLPRGKPRTRHMWICLQLSGARGVDNGDVKGCDVPHASQPGEYPLAVLSHQNFILHKGSQLPTPCTVLQESCLCLFFFFIALVKTGLTLPSIQLMHHHLTPLPGS